MRPPGVTYRSRHVTSPELPDRPLPPGRHGLPRELVVTTQRNRILRALVAAVAQRGYGGTSVADVIRGSGVSRRTFYQHYPDLEAAFLAGYDAITEVLEQRFGAAVTSAGGGWPDQVAAGLNALLSSLAAEPASARACIVEVRAAGSAALKRRSEVLAQFIPVIEAGNEHAGISPPLPRAVSVGIIGGIEELVYLQILDGDTERLTELLPEVLQVAMLPFLGPGRAADEAAAAVARLAEGAG
jgi:AcrR family transcriptional regulator